MGLGVLIWNSLDYAQERTSPQPATRAATGPPFRESLPGHEGTPTRAAAMATALNPTDYGPAFYTGAQAEFVAGASGLSSLLVGYDAVWLHIDLGTGLGLGGDALVDAAPLRTLFRGSQIGRRRASRDDLLAQVTSRRHVEVCSPECVSVSPAPGNVQELESLERVRNRRVDDQSSVLHVQAE